MQQDISEFTKISVTMILSAVLLAVVITVASSAFSFGDMWTTKLSVGESTAASSDIIALQKNHKHFIDVYKVYYANEEMINSICLQKDGIITVFYLRKADAETLPVKEGHYPENNMLNFNAMEGVFLKDYCYKTDYDIKVYPTLRKSDGTFDIVMVPIIRE